MRASAGRGMNATRSGSLMDKTSSKAREGDTPSWWMSCVKRTGLDSSGK